MSGFARSVSLRNWPLKLPICIVLDVAGSRKCRIFVVKRLKISQKLHGGDRKHNKVCKKKKLKQANKQKKQNQKCKNRQMSYFHPYANFSSPYLKIGLCDLFPVLFECITYRHYGNFFTLSYQFCQLYYHVE